MRTLHAPRLQPALLDLPIVPIFSRVRILESTMALSGSMQFRQSGQADDRRRRVLADGLAGGTRTGATHSIRPEPESASEDSKPDGPHYPEASVLSERLRLAVLVPQRLISYGLLLLAGAALLSVIGLLHAWAPKLASLLRVEHVTAFDILAPNGLCTWFAATTMAAAALGAILVYLVRRFRVDDYQAQYRIWLWAAMCWLFVSADEGSQLHELVRNVAVRASGTPLIGDGSIWWIAVFVFLLGGVQLRLLVEMRHCWLSDTVFVLGLAGYWISISLRLSEATVLGSLPPAVFGRLLTVSGYWLILLAMLLHARHVILDAEGALPAPKPKCRRKIPREEKAAQSGKATQPEKPAPRAADKANYLGVAGTDPPHELPVRRAQHAAAPATVSTAPVAATHTLKLGGSAPATAATGSVASESESGHHALSKAEKKALRKRLEEMRRSREGGL